ncbi:MAG: CHASE domain-containing protein [Hahellaceae bacterium]|nr:CHASE domain-containing protein [Hahellaceae bacterium]
MADKSLADRLHGGLAAWIILVCSVVITFTAWYLSSQFVRDRVADRFNFQVEDIRLRIVQRLHDQYLILQAGLSLMESSDSVSRQKWKTFVQGLDLPNNFPGLLGYGYSVMLRPDQLSEHIASIQAEGFPDFVVKPPGERDQYSSIIFLEPFDWRNQRAFGFDMYSEATRRAAMDQAIETGEMSISGRVTLVQETKQDVQHGFLMYLPFYGNTDTPLAGPDERRKHIVGFVYSPFRMKDLMMGILGQRDNTVNYTLEDVTDSQQPLILYHSDPVVPVDQPDPDYEQSELRRSLPIEFGGRVWRLKVHAEKDFVPDYENVQPLFVAVLGGVIDVLLFAVLLSLAGQKKRAMTLANQMSQEVREQAVRLQTIVDGVDEAIVTIDARGKILSVNASTSTYFGYRASELLGQNVTKFMPRPLAAQHDDFLHNYQKTGISNVVGATREVVGYRADGTTFPLELRVKEMVLGNQTVFLGVMRDLTEQKRVERLKSEFISTVSHELRTPLTAIKGALSLVAGGVAGALPDKAKELLGMAELNSKRLTVLINDLLDMEKFADGSLSISLKSSQLSELLNEALESNREYAKRFSCTLVGGEWDDTLFIRVDPVRFQQIMANLISNAVKFSPEGSAVTVVCQTEGVRVRIWVVDKGPGISSEFQARMFERFSQADGSTTRTVGGSGLGLYIAKQLVEKMGGLIGFECPPSGGTRFFVEFNQFAAGDTSDGAAAG